MAELGRFSSQPSNRRFAVVTTCSSEGFEIYGRRMIESFDRYWPNQICLHLYAEGFTPDYSSPRIVVHDLKETCPELTAFKKRHEHRPLAHGREHHRRILFRVRPRKLRMALRLVDWGVGWRWDAVRFSHKIFAIDSAAGSVDADVLYWVDADTVFFDHVPLAALEELMPESCFVSYLGRKNISECGFVGYNLRHPETEHFIESLTRFYTSDSIFREKEYHDSYLFDRLRRRFEREGAQSYNISEGIIDEAGHVLVNSRLGQFMDHLKGDRKASGSSRIEDLTAERSEAYWRNRTGNHMGEGG